MPNVLKTAKSADSWRPSAERRKIQTLDQCFLRCRLRVWGKDTMKIKALTVNRFRGYSSTVTVEVDDLLVLVGRNDIGKSTLLEALDIFFNEGRGCVKMDKDDINKDCLAQGQDCIEIGVEFTDLPENIVIDATNQTTLQEEHLLRII